MPAVRWQTRPRQQPTPPSALAGRPLPGQIGQSRLPTHLITLLQPVFVRGHAADPKACGRHDDADLAIRWRLPDKVDGRVVTVMAREARLGQGRGLAQQITVQGGHTRRLLAIAERAGEHHGYCKHFTHIN